MYKNITISRLKEVKDEGPTHAIVVADKDYQNKQYVGKLWTKEGQDGSKYLSGKLDEARTYEGKAFKGWVIISEDEYKSLKSSQANTGEADPNDLPF